MHLYRPAPPQSYDSSSVSPDIRDTPQSIDVIPARVIQDLNTSRIDRALDFAGGVARQNNFGGLTFLNYSVRGFTTGELYKNGFAINRGSYSSPDTSNIERIEVLKGPAASLYGRGDPGGLVNIVTKRPRPEAFSTLSFSAGTWDRYRSNLDVNTPLDSEGNLLARVNLAVEDNGRGNCAWPTTTPKARSRARAPSPKPWSARPSAVSTASVISSGTTPSPRPSCTDTSSSAVGSIRR